jgi:hypothetical protein
MAIAKSLVEVRAETIAAKETGGGAELVITLPRNISPARALILIEAGVR